MLKRSVVFLLSLLFSSTLVAQVSGNGCDKIKEGTFYLYPKNTSKQGVIKRYDGLQKEYENGSGDSSVWKAEWKGDCTLSLKLIQSSRVIRKGLLKQMKQTEFIVKILEVTDDYYIRDFGTGIKKFESIAVDTVWRHPRE